MISPLTDEGKNSTTEIEENTSAINKLIEKLEEKIVINQLETDNEESEVETENE